MNYNFTDQVRKVLAMAREEAIRLGHDYVGAEHQLLGLLREEEGVVAAVLQQLGVNRDEVRRQVLERVPMPQPRRRRFRFGDLPYNRGAKRVLEGAMAEARLLGHSYVGVEHFLLAFFREEQEIAGRVIRELGLSLDATRREVLAVLGDRAVRYMAPEIRVLQPAGWAPPRGYANGMMASGRLIFIAGQIGWNPATGEFESDDFVAQVRQALHNAVAVLQDGGGNPEHVTRLTWYITDKQAYLASQREIGAAYREAFGRYFPPMTLVVVSALLEDRAKVEIEATAVVPER